MRDPDYIYKIAYRVAILNHDAEVIRKEIKEIKEIQHDSSSYYFKNFGLRTITIHASDIATTISKSILQ